MSRWMKSSRNGVVALPVMPSAAACDQARSRIASSSSGGSCLSVATGLASRIACGRPSASRASTTDATCSGRVDRVRDRVAGVGDVEARVARGAVAEHRDVERLEPLERRRDVEDGLHAGADHQDGCGRQDGHVRGLVERLRRPVVHAAETAGREDADAGMVRQERGRGDGRPAVQPEGDRHRQVAQRDLVDAVRVRQLGDLGDGEPDGRDAAVDADGGGHDALGAQPGLGLERDVEVARPRQPVREDRRLEGKDGPPVADRLGTSSDTRIVDIGPPLAVRSAAPAWRHDPGSPWTRTAAARSAGRSARRAAA